jgi:hypothetical protein
MDHDCAGRLRLPRVGSEISRVSEIVGDRISVRSRIRASYFSVGNRCRHCRAPWFLFLRRQCGPELYFLQEQSAVLAKPIGAGRRLENPFLSLTSGKGMFWGHDDVLDCQPSGPFSVMLRSVKHLPCQFATAPPQDCLFPPKGKPRGFGQFRADGFRRRTGNGCRERPIDPENPWQMTEVSWSRRFSGQWQLGCCEPPQAGRVVAIPRKNPGSEKPSRFSSLRVGFR